MITYVYVVLLVKVIDFKKSKLKISVFQLNEEGPAAEELDDEELAAASHWLLPAGTMHHLPGWAEEFIG